MPGRLYPRILGGLLALILVGLSCNLLQGGRRLQSPATPQAVLQPSPTPEQPATAIPKPEEPRRLTPTGSPSPEPTKTPAPPAVRIGPCEGKVCLLPFDFPFSRPILQPGRDRVDASYRFGSSDQGKRDTHHGVEFLNSAGTPVLAAAGGEVVVAGDDTKTIYGYFRNMYGNLVVLKHTLPEFDQPVFTLYAHLSKVDVQEGDPVEGGQKIGEVGSTGSATGSHLHFEVRFGENTYAASRNPELWLQPLPDPSGQPMGAVAGRILDGQGRQVEVSNVVVERISNISPGSRAAIYLNTYSEDKLVGLDPWQESFAAGDLPAGEYKISFYYVGMQQRIVEVRPGELTLVTFEIQ